MKKNIKLPIKLRNKFTQDVFYTLREWPVREIDGVTFLPVVKTLNEVTPNRNTYHYIRKDSLESVK